MFECNKQIKRIQEKVISKDNDLEKIDPEEYCFISTISHCVFTPLTAIKGYSSLLLEGSLGDISNECKERIEKIFNDSQSFITMVEKFIDTSGSEKPMFYKFDSDSIENKDKDPTDEKEGGVELQNIKSEFIQLSNSQFSSLSKEIKDDAIALQEYSFGESSEKISEAIQKIIESSENLVETIKSFSGISKS